MRLYTLLAKYLSGQESVSKRSCRETNNTRHLNAHRPHVLRDIYGWDDV